MRLGGLLNWGVLIKESVLGRVAEEVFAVRHFIIVYENLIESPKFLSVIAHKGPFIFH
jgi:hypothetical protein